MFLAETMITVTHESRPSLNGFLAKALWKSRGGGGGGYEQSLNWANLFTPITRSTMHHNLVPRWRKWAREDRPRRRNLSDNIQNLQLLINSKQTWKTKGSPSMIHRQRQLLVWLKGGRSLASVLVLQAYMKLYYLRVHFNFYLTHGPTSLINQN